jgi:conjugal transfer pilus assembly protein TraL
MDQYYIPRYLDEPFKIALLTVDELTAMVVPLLFGLLVFNSPICGLFIGLILVGILKKFKGEEGHYYLLHLMYWHLPSIYKMRSTPPSHVRELLG